MISFFCCPKAMEGEIGSIQKRAIESWKSIPGVSEVVLLGDASGVEEYAVQEGLGYHRTLRCNEKGVPFVSSIFELIQKSAKNKICAYINADIILIAREDISYIIRKWGRKNILMIGERRNIQPSALNSYAAMSGTSEGKVWLENNSIRHGPTGIDYFIFTKGLYKGVPDFVLGRCAWDNWLVHRARIEKALIIDMSDPILAIHQNHDYLHASVKTSEELWESPDALKNNQLACDQLCDLRDCEYKAQDGDIEIVWNSCYLDRYADFYAKQHPRLWKWMLSWKIRNKMIHGWSMIRRIQKKYI